MITVLMMLVGSRTDVRSCAELLAVERIVFLVPLRSWEPIARKIFTTMREGGITNMICMW